MWNQIESYAVLIDQGKTDSAVKILLFPKSLRVVENITAGFSDLHQDFNKPKQIRRTLLKVDPIRIIPAKSGESFGQNKEVVLVFYRLESSLSWVLFILLKAMRIISIC
jgi:hypothetical protein